MPAKSERQRRFMGAELSRKRAGERTRTNMSEDKLSEFTSKQKLNYRGAWVNDPALRSSRNLSLNRATVVESKGIARAAQREKQKRHAKAHEYGKNPFQKEEVADMNHEDFVSQLDKHINHLEKRRMYTPEESRESFDRIAEKEQRQRDFDDDNRQRRERGEEEKPVTHVDRSVKFRDLENKKEINPSAKFRDEESRDAVELQDDNISQNAEYQAAIASNKAETNARQSEESEDIARREAYSKRNRLADVEIFGTEEDYQDAVADITPRDKELMESGYPSKVRNIDQPRVVKSKTLRSKDLLPAQDSNGDFIANGTIPFTPETTQLMSLAADAISTYINKDYADDDEVDTKAARRNKRKASQRKMKISGTGVKDSQRIIGRKAAQARGESVD